MGTPPAAAGAIGHHGLGDDRLRPGGGGRRGHGYGLAFRRDRVGAAAWLGIDVEEQPLAPAQPDVELGSGVIRTGSVADGEGRLIRGVVAPGGWFSAPVAGDYSVSYSVGPSLCGPDLVVDRTLRIPAPGRYSLPGFDELLKIDCPADTPLQEGFPNPAVLALVTGPETEGVGTIFNSQLPLGGS